MSKSRLSPLLSIVERRALSDAMAKDVVSVLASSKVFDDIVICAGDEVPPGLARPYDAKLVREAQLGTRGLNNALNTLLASLREEGAKGAVIVHSDLPLLSTHDIMSITRHMASADTVLVPDRVGGGSNIVATALDKPLRLQFGGGSRIRHRHYCQHHNLTLRECYPMGARWDIDVPSDLGDIGAAAFLRCGRHTRRYLSGNGLLSRCYTHAVNPSPTQPSIQAVRI